MNYERVKYFLESSKWQNRKELRFEPENWNEDDKTLVRSSDSHGVFTQLSNNLAFVKDGYDLIYDHYQQFGTEVDLRLIRRIKGGLNEGYITDYEGDLDLKTIKLGNNRLDIQFLSGGLQSIVESQKSEKYELERTTDLDGKPISLLQYLNVNFQGRNIFLESLLSGTQGRIYLLPRLLGGQEYKSALIDVTYESDDSIAAQSNPAPVTLNSGDNTYITGGDMFYFSNREAVRRIKVSGSFNMFSVDNVDYPPYEFNPYVTLQLHFFTVNENSTYTHLPNETLNVATSNVIDEWVSFEENFFLSIDDNVSVSLLYKYEGSNLTMTLKENDMKLLFLENSEYPATNMKGVRVFDAGNRLLEIYTGNKNRFKSSLFGGFNDGYQEDGIWERTVLTSGKHIRNINDSKIALSFKELFGLDNYFNLGYGVENGILRLEKKEYFYQDKVFIDLGEVDDLKISIDEKMLYSSLTFGNKKAGSYEEVQGLAEYNALTTYQSFLKSADNKYEVDGEIRADAIGAEIARRKQFSEAPTEDTSYDNEIFVFRLHPEINKLRTWQFDYAATPIVYDPDTAFNLELTPFESMRRHSNWFNSGLTKNLDEKTRYSNGTGNVDVVKKRIEDDTAYAEDGNILNSKLKKPIALPEILDFTFPLNTGLNRKMFGKTEINGNFVNNFYLLVKLKYKETVYYGWIKEVNLNNPAKWQLIRKYNA
jgi:hypothetical protein